jgi:S1-C subfamily serine protease
MMNNRVLIVLGLLVALSAMLFVGALAGGGIVYALTRRSDAFPVVRAQAVDTETGIVIASIDPESPAAEAGVVRGDILLAIDDEALENTGDLVRYLGDLEPGDEVELTVQHGDDQRALTATLGERDGRAYLGLVPCGGLPRRISVHVGMPGASIVEVMPDSPAEDAGLEAGDVILAVNGQELDSEHPLADLITGYEPGDTVALEVERPGEEPYEVTAQLGEHPEKEDVAYLGVRYVPFPHMGVAPDVVVPFFEHEEFELDELPFALPHGEIGEGLLLLRVAEDSPASAAGLKAGDVIAAIDGESVGSWQAFVETIAERAPGDRVNLTVRPRGDEEEREVEVVLGEHPDEEGKAYLGVTGWLSPYPRLDKGDILPFGEDFDLHDLPFISPEGEIQQGVIVRRVYDDSPASAAGLENGDVITAIDGEAVDNPRALTDAIAERAPGDRITLTLHRSGEEEGSEVEVRLQEHPDEEGKAYLGVSIGGFFRMHRSEGDERPHMFQFSLPHFDFDDLPFDLDELRRRFNFGSPQGEDVPVRWPELSGQST